MFPLLRVYERTLSKVLKMASQARRTAFPKVLIERDTDSEQSSTDEDEGEEDPPSEEDSGNENDEKNDVFSDSKKKGKSPITVSLKKVCKACKRTGHEAGFKGATYIDCPMMPCFLCKMPDVFGACLNMEGHTTMTCPHRVATEHGVIPAPHINTQNPVEFIFERQLRPRITPIKPAYLIPDQVNCAAILYHSRRITCLEFHPTNNHILLSGDKKGQLGVWDFDKVHEKTVYGNIHSCILNNMRSLESKPFQGPKTWRILYGMDINSEKCVVLVADNFGFLYLVDSRSHNQTGNAVMIHKKGRKVVGLHCNPLQPDLLLSCGNDHFARMWDMRQLEAGSALANINTGQLAAEVMDPNITTISPVNKIHTRDDVLATGSSRSLFIWRPKEKHDVAERLETRKIVVFGGDEKKLGKRSKDDYDDDSDDGKFNFKGKNVKVKKSTKQTTHRKEKS
ncbi:Protein DAMAGED DNA-BINDING 2 [Hibiscus syriacus]|uniref:Protein DAMAGED DNA-BINDING 2 n=1 Tax=Hibiscus syriacus TaxID=106335 RepID=A0A6A3CYA9_HIBSY|nr:Protein DAMAGED DNA-BINDING 2 [Hibiscus syriacus]